MIYFGGYFYQYLSINFFDIKWRALTVIDFDARASRFFDLGFRNFQYEVKVIQGKVVFVSDQVYQLLSPKLNSVFILGFFYGIIDLIIDETMKRLEFSPFFVEGIIILSIPIMFFIYSKYKQINNKNIFYLNYIYSVLPAIILFMIIH